MTIVDLQQLPALLGDLIRRVRDQGEKIYITDHDEVIAWLVPPEVSSGDAEQNLAVFDAMDETAAQIGERWPAGVSAVDAIRVQRGQT